MLFSLVQKYPFHESLKTSDSLQSKWNPEGFLDPDFQLKSVKGISEPYLLFPLPRQKSIELPLSEHNSNRGSLAQNLIDRETVFLYSESCRLLEKSASGATGLNQRISLFHATPTKGMNLFNVMLILYLMGHGANPRFIFLSPRFKVNFPRRKTCFLAAPGNFPISMPRQTGVFRESIIAVVPSSDKQRGNLHSLSFLKTL